MSTKDERQARLEADRERRSAERDSAEQLQRALPEAAAQFANALRPFLTAAVEAFRLLANDPVIRFAMEHPEILSGPRERPCHCLCGKAHPGESGICTAQAVTERRYTTETLGDVDVPLCGPCAVAQGVMQPR